MTIRSMICSAAAISAAAVIADPAVSGSNVCALMQVPSTTANTMIAVPWVKVGAGTAVEVAKLVKTDSLSQGDELYFYDGSTYYHWVLGATGWEGSTTASQSGTFTAPGADYAIPAGRALWVVRQDTSKDIWLYGQVPASTSVTPAAGTSTAPVYTMIANPNTADFDLNASGVVGADGDQIMVNGESDKLYTFDGTNWKRYVTTSKTLGSKTVNLKTETADGCTIPAGIGAWYISKGGSPTINW